MANDRKEEEEEGPATSYLLLLKPPLSSAEGVQEILDAAALTEQQQPPSATTTIKVNDPTTIQTYFPTKTTTTTTTTAAAALLITSRAAADAIRQWSARHRAIYALAMAPLTRAQARSVARAAHGIVWPCTVFLHGALALGVSPETVTVAVAARPARLVGHTLVERRARSGDKGFVLVVPTPTTTNNRSRATATATATLKLRPAMDVLKRLRHDAATPAADYRVTYTDRFAGEVTLDATQWRGDVSDDDFVPQHRIVRFERKWDGVTVWERATRTDLLFGSGASLSSSRAVLGGVAVEGLAYEVQTEEQGARFVGLAPDMCVLLPCIIEFLDTQGGSTKGMTFGCM